MAQPGRRFGIENVGDHMLLGLEEQRDGRTFACVEPITFEQSLNTGYVSALLDQMLDEMRK